jgi:hypothetical protein
MGFCALKYENRFYPFFAGTANELPSDVCVFAYKFRALSLTSVWMSVTLVL